MPFPRLRSFLTAWTRRERFEDALDAEVRFHLHACTDDLVRSGVPRREAVRRARIQFGGIEGVKDDCRHARGLRLADEAERLVGNARYGLRMLVKTPVVTGVAIVSLALGIGSNATIFSPFSQVLLRPLPVVEPERLVNLEAPGRKSGSTTTGPAGGIDEILEPAAVWFTMAISLGTGFLFGLYPTLHASSARAPDVRGWTVTSRKSFEFVP